MDVAALKPAEEHDDTDDAEGIEGQLLAQHVHADLQRRLRRLSSK